MAFGPIGRGWKPRSQLAGTYDQHWLDNVFPFLPADFDSRYYQAAPLDQQTPYPRGGEVAAVQNLTPNGLLQFRLPDLSLPVEFVMKNGKTKQQQAIMDTIYIEPELKRVLLVWRASIPLRNNMFDVVQVIVGKLSKAFYRARETGKEYNPLQAQKEEA